MSYNRKQVSLLGSLDRDPVLASQQKMIRSISTPTYTKLQRHQELMQKVLGPVSALDRQQKLLRAIAAPTFSALQQHQSLMHKVFDTTPTYSRQQEMTRAITAPAYSALQQHQGLMHKVFDTTSTYSRQQEMIKAITAPTYSALQQNKALMEKVLGLSVTYARQNNKMLRATSAPAYAGLERQNDILTRLLSPTPAISYKQLGLTSRLIDNVISLSAIDRQIAFNQQLSRDVHASHLGDILPSFKSKLQADTAPGDDTADSFDLAAFTEIIEAADAPGTDLKNSVENATVLEEASSSILEIVNEYREGKIYTLINNIFTACAKFFNNPYVFNIICTLIIIPMLVSVLHIQEQPTALTVNSYTINEIKTTIEIHSQNRGIEQEALLNLRIVTCQKLYVRNGSRLKARIIGIIRYGDVVEKVKQNKNWTFIRYLNELTGEEVKGWVFTRYLTRITSRN